MNEYVNMYVCYFLHSKGWTDVICIYVFFKKNKYLLYLFIIDYSFKVLIIWEEPQLQ